MPELLHAWAIGPAALGTCCLAADRARARPPELAASALMLLAMLDAAVTRMVAAVWWAALLAAAAIALAAWRTPRRPVVRARHGASTMVLHTTTGMVAMAALQLGAMHAPAADTLHAHALPGAGLTTPLAVGALVYAAFSLALARRARGVLDRVQAVAMGACVALMALPLFM